MAETQYFEIVDWEKFEYSDEQARPCIKLYPNILQDYKFTKLSDTQRSHLLALMLLRAICKAKLPWDESWLQNHISSTEKVDLIALEQAGFIRKIPVA